MRLLLAWMNSCAATLNVHGRYLHRNVIEYVERLVSLHHDGIESAILAYSGTEATKLAIRMARNATGKHGIICTDTTYHGNSSVVGQLPRRIHECTYIHECDRRMTLCSSGNEQAGPDRCS